VRTCRQGVESEAYAVAIALLLPYRTVFDHFNDGGEIATIPADVPISDEGRRYRVKIAVVGDTVRLGGGHGSDDASTFSACEVNGVVDNNP
jgi:hypothetical protein